MLNKILTTTTAITIAFGAISTASLTILSFTADAAYAGNGNNGNGNGGDRGNSNRDNGNRGGGNNGNAGGNGNGAIASALGALNAAHANENAFANASANSRVGLIAAYRDAAVLTGELATLADEELAALELLTVPDRTSEEIQDELDQAIIDGLDTVALEAELEDALAYEAAVESYEAAALAAEEQEGIEAGLLEDASNKTPPTGEALDALRVMLGLE